MRRLQLLALAFALSCANAQEEKVRILPADFNGDRENQMMRSFLRKKVHAALDRGRTDFEALKKPEQIEAYQQRLKAFFEKTIDLASFKKTRLKPQVTGVLKRDDYRIENVMFESLPDFHVTGNLYIPEGEGPFPAILHPCGHTENGKAAGVYQFVNQLLVRNGFVVLCYDPIGQGERKQLINEKGAGLLKSTSEHQALGRAPILLGRGLASYMIWDGIRALDFLETRPEVDGARLGCTGNSGGGNMTSFLMALDDRIQVAAPGCFMTTTRMKNEKPGPGDPEQNLFAQIREGLDHPDFAIIRAPKPTLILAATQDFVPIEGTWDAFRQAKRIYTKLGVPECIELIETDEKHGYSKRLREGAVRFFARWLQRRDVVISEPDDLVEEKVSDLLCSMDGQVLKMKGERTIFDLNAERSIELESERKEAWGRLSMEGKRNAVRGAVGISNIEFQVVMDADRSGPKFLRKVVASYDGISMPQLRILPDAKAPADEWVKLCFGSEKTIGDRSKLVETLAKYGNGEKRDPIWSATMVFTDLCDIGETKTVNWRFYGADSMISYMLGESYLEYRVEEMIALAKYERNRNGAKNIILQADGELVPAALHAAALEPDLFDSITLHGGLKSWDSLMRNPNPISETHNIVHGVLKVYDLPDLVKLIPEGKLEWKEKKASTKR